MPKDKIKKVVAKKAKKLPVKATIKQRKALKAVVENGGNMGKAMQEAGYSKAMAKNPQKLKESEGWKGLMKEVGLDDKSLLKSHKELLQQTRIDYFVFPKGMKDEEIKRHVKAAGLKVITIRESEKGKMAFYSIADPQAKKAALEMAYKLRGAFDTKDDGTVVAVQVNTVLVNKKDEYGI